MATVATMAIVAIAAIAAITAIAITAARAFVVVVEALVLAAAPVDLEGRDDDAPFEVHFHPLVISADVVKERTFGAHRAENAVTC